MISMEIITFANIAPSTQKVFAQEISNYTNGRLDELPQMLPKTKEQITKKYIGFVALSCGELAGFVGADEPKTGKAYKCLR